MQNPSDVLVYRTENYKTIVVNISLVLILSGQSFQEFHGNLKGNFTLIRKELNNLSRRQHFYGLNLQQFIPKKLLRHIEHYFAFILIWHQRQRQAKYEALKQVRKTEWQNYFCNISVLLLFNNASNIFSRNFVAN